MIGILRDVAAARQCRNLPRFLLRAGQAKA
jgi:hypothetical protein